MNKKDLEHLYNEYFQTIYKNFYFKVFDQQTAEDLTSETFLGLADYIKNSLVVNNPKGLIYKIANSTFNQYLRRKYNEVNLDMDSIEFYEDRDSYLENFESEDKFLIFIKGFIKRIPKQQAKILQKRLVEKKSLSIICEELKKDMNYVKTTQRRAISSLKKLLEKDKCIPNKH